MWSGWTERLELHYPKDGPSKVRPGPKKKKASEKIRGFFFFLEALPVVRTSWQQNLPGSAVQYQLTYQIQALVRLALE